MPSDREVTPGGGSDSLGELADPYPPGWTVSIERFSDGRWHAWADRSNPFRRVFSGLSPDRAVVERELVEKIRATQPAVDTPTRGTV